MIIRWLRESHHQPSLLSHTHTHTHRTSTHQAVFSLTRLALPFLEAAATESDPARVLNVGSIDGLRVGLVDHFAYSASKAAVHRLTQVGAVLWCDSNDDI